jgi:hypothetical protein
MDEDNGGRFRRQPDRGPLPAQPAGGAGGPVGLAWLDPKPAIIDGLVGVYILPTVFGIAR